LAVDFNRPVKCLAIEVEMVGTNQYWVPLINADCRLEQTCQRLTVYKTRSTTTLLCCCF